MRRRLSCLCMAAALCFCGGIVARADTTGTVTASMLALRSGPGQSYELVAEAPMGTRLAILMYSDGWYYVEYGGLYGYVYARYVRLALPEATGSPAPTMNLQPVWPTTPGAVSTAPPTLTLPELTYSEDNNPAYPRVLKPGDTGDAVTDLQRTLQAMGYETGADGKYGYDTQAAVMKLQREMGIDPDGIVGDQTRKLMGYSAETAVELLDWWLGGTVAFARQSEATIIDVGSGQRFKARRTGGDNHCDAEPLTASDTEIFLAIAGGEWSWERRAVWVKAGGRVFAASMVSMPHDEDTISDNNYAGHFCIHLYNSRTHDTDRIDEEHAACVWEAWSLQDQYAP